MQEEFVTLETLMKMILSCTQRLRGKKSTSHWIRFPFPRIRYTCQSVCHVASPQTSLGQARVITMKNTPDAEGEMTSDSIRKLPVFWKSTMDILTFTDTNRKVMFSQKNELQSIRNKEEPSPLTESYSHPKKAQKVALIMQPHRRAIRHSVFIPYLGFPRQNILWKYRLILPLLLSLLISHWGWPSSFALCI